MDRQDRIRRDRNEPGLDYDRYEGYSRNDAHYHSAKNLTNEFEQEYQRERGHWDNDRGRYGIDHTYHEGDSIGDYARRRSEGRGFRGEDAGYRQHDWDRNRTYGGGFSRDSYRDDRDENRGTWGRYSSDRDRNQAYGDSPQRYGSSDRTGSYGRYDDGRGRGEQDYYSGSRSDYGSSRYTDRNYGSDTRHEGGYGVRGGNRGDLDDSSGDNWRARHRLRSDF